MATNCDFIEEHMKQQPLGIREEAKQDVKEKPDQLPEKLPPSTNPYQHFASEDSFECAFESTMDDLEQGTLDGYESDSETSANEQITDSASSGSLSQVQREERTRGLPGPLHGQHIDQEMLKCLPRSNSFDFHSSSGSSSDDEDDPDDNDDHDEIQHSLGLTLSGKFAKVDLYSSHQRPGYLLAPFIERRRLSQCKEEDDEDGEVDKTQPPGGSSAGAGEATKAERASKAPPRPPTPQDEASKEKFKDLERLRQQFMHKIDRINTRNIEESKAPPPPPPPPPPIPATILPKALKALLHTQEPPAPPPAHPAPVKPPAINPAPKKEAMVAKETPKTPPVASEPISPLPLPSEPPLIIKGKFKVTLAKETPELRVEAQKLSQMTVSSNAHTISFPSSFGGYSSVQGLFSQRYGSNRFPVAAPHLSKQFFEPSLVEIRTPAQSNVALNTTGLVLRNSSNHQSLNCDTNNLANKQRTPSERELDEIWIRRQDGALDTSSLAAPPPFLQQQPQQQRPVSLGGASTMPRLLRTESGASTTSPSRQLTNSGSVSVSVSDDVSRKVIDHCVRYL